MSIANNTYRKNILLFVAEDNSEPASRAAARRSRKYCDSVINEDVGNVTQQGRDDRRRDEPGKSERITAAPRENAAAI